MARCTMRVALAVVLLVAVWSALAAAAPNAPERLDATGVRSNDSVDVDATDDATTLLGTTTAEPSLSPGTETPTSETTVLDTTVSETTVSDTTVLDATTTVLSSPTNDTETTLPSTSSLADSTNSTLADPSLSTPTGPSTLSTESSGSADADLTAGTNLLAGRLDGGEFDSGNLDSGNLDGSTPVGGETVTLGDRLATDAAGEDERGAETAGSEGSDAGNQDSADHTVSAGVDAGVVADRPDEPAAPRSAEREAADGDGTPIPAISPRTGGAVGVGALGAAALTAYLSDGVGTVSGATSGARPAVEAARAGFGRFRRLVAPFRYSRHDDSDPLENETRAALYETVERSPGTYLSAISERADVSLSTARHHLDVLESEGFVTGAKVRGKRRFYPADVDDAELAAALEDEGTAPVLRALARLGPSHGGRLADDLRKDPSTVSHHLSRLEAAGLVERERDGRAVVNRLTPEVRAALGGDESDADSRTVAD
ncbi:helix-turn-helix domain-containing protein [Halorussus vallis]|uniref:winged helix-turn-helix transcriptional regulator n=1 Tax=Halorussus vallis TaxID=2953749 RepID=UPI00209F0963|nr:helix-turn-helix domain-containing protein [Halorussus vallis]USZ74662.1 helix-turn-helix domain-containing protein [Halorussus vallis]